MSQPLNFQCNVEQKYYSIIHLMIHYSFNEKYHLKSCIRDSMSLWTILFWETGPKIECFFQLGVADRVLWCAARLDAVCAVWGAPMGERCCWWGCGLGALESAIVFFGHWGLKRCLHPTLGFSKCFVIFLSVKLFSNLWRNFNAMFFLLDIKYRFTCGESVL